MICYFLQLLLLCVLQVQSNLDKTYDVPIPDINIRSNGFDVSINDEDGISLVYFYGKIMNASENEIVVMKSYEKTENTWILRSNYNNLKEGDIIYYWLYIKKNGVGYRLTPQYYKVSEPDCLTRLPAEELKENNHYQTDDYLCEITCAYEIQKIKHTLSKIKQKMNFLNKMLSDLSLPIEAAVQSFNLSYINNYAIY
ncbi:hypothetical protein RN001_003192 [Aquatica leii]|uniref:CBM39 domain-containing protein n=1 Tax=Aquatica leii TaxID=1421715 RepID=A0AAN7SDT0_9COLE|nr:hypothetical protein RN001_003192 [Aquatica leii]